MKSKMMIVECGYIVFKRDGNCPIYNRVEEKIGFYSNEAPTGEKLRRMFNCVMDAILW